MIRFRASSDVVLSIRTDLEPAQRGLQPISPAERPIVWAIPADYPDRLRGLGKLRGTAPLREWTPETPARTPSDAARSETP